MAKIPNYELKKEIPEITQYEDDIIVKVKCHKTKKVPPLKPDPVELQEKVDDFKIKLAEERFDEFEVYDWRNYFQKKAIDNNFYFRYTNKPNRNIREKQIIEDLMSEFSSQEIKNMMDFLWEAPHKIADKSTITLSHLCGGWMNQVVTQTIDWMKGNFGKDKDKTIREYKPTEENKPAKSRVYI
jgi:hypothetical protein